MSNSNLQIVEASKEDISSIQHIAYETWPITYGSIQSKEQLDYMLELIYSASSLKKQMNNGSKFLLIK